MKRTDLVTSLEELRTFLTSTREVMFPHGASGLKAVFWHFWELDLEIEKGESKRMELN